MLTKEIIKYYLLKLLVEIIVALTPMTFKKQWLLKKAGINKDKFKKGDPEC